MVKKLFIVVLCFVAVSLLLCYCNFKRETFWTEEDFSFYDENGKERIFPTVGDYRISLGDYEGLRTYRGVELGDRAKNISDLYDLTDFEYSICDLSKLNPSTYESEEFEKQLKDEGKTVEDILEMLPEISGEDLDVYLWCDIYEKNGKLFTESGWEEISDEEIIEYYGWREMGIPEEDIKITEERIELYKFEHIKYSISFSIENEKIIDVSIKSTYHNRLQ